MPAFFEYLRNITYYLMFATVAGLITPAGKYKKFVSLVLGFILLVLMLRPLAGLAQSGEAPITQWFTGLIPITEQTDSETSYTRWRDTYLREAFEAQLEAQLTALLVGAGFAVHRAEIEYSDDFSRITQVRVDVSREEVTQRRPFIRIQPVQPIRIGETQEEEQPDCPTAIAAKNLISEFYNLPPTHIHVNVT